MTHQTGITALGVSDHAYLELDLVDGADPAEAVGRLAAAVNQPTTIAANIVVGVRPELWARVAPAGAAPEGVHGFNEPIRGPGGYAMPATQHDAWIWVSASARSRCFDVAKLILGELDGVLRVADEIVGWVYETNRDLTGFEDGTENPGALEAPGVVAVPAGRPGAGSSVLLFQKWEHRSRDWEGLGEDRQEEIIGRTKADSVEFDDEVKPEDSHVARSVVEVDGEELDVYRRNVAYGDFGEHGTVFVGFSHDQWRLEQMLVRMAGADGGPRDTLTRFTDALTGSWYVCPAVEALAEVAEPYLPEEED
ncbi:peroxidase [Corynebacterium sphenisci DSM 44792]|uniref:Peroxidase n=1 Tax=Corynebacterium sphenisci DSM 44792 TaxID=1437874 RepID=A0A1L7D0N9_9CORY|nr:Dyp-type peroxidase [Corynebacterium sphenisci]APT91521.1 peroxidase [Corynebacterium sphenisci DSM 44792]